MPFDKSSIGFPIIDAHSHVWYGKQPPATVEANLASLDQAGISQTVIMAGDIGGHATRAILNDVAPHRDRLQVVANVSAKRQGCGPTPAELDDWLARGQVSGLKFYPGYEDYYPHDPRLRPWLEVLQAHGRPVIFHSGDLLINRRTKIKYAHPLEVDELAAEMPNLRIIIAHFGYPWAVDAAIVCRRHEHVYADCSGFGSGAPSMQDALDFRHWLGEFRRVAGGFDKMLFGTDWPIVDRTAYLRTCRSIFGDDRRVFHDSAAELFGLDDAIP